MRTAESTSSPQPKPQPTEVFMPDSIPVSVSGALDCGSLLFCTFIFLVGFRGCCVDPIVTAIEHNATAIERQTEVIEHGPYK